MLIIILLINNMQVWVIGCLECLRRLFSALSAIKLLSRSVRGDHGLLE